LTRLGDRADNDDPFDFKNAGDEGRGQTKMIDIFSIEKTKSGYA
jgi:hypothetical protein